MCDLCKERKNVVFLRGEIPADILFIGEGPGEFEDSEGRPFIGPAGNLLNQMISEAKKRVGIAFSTCFGNSIGCIPKSNGQKLETPHLDHVEACLQKVKDEVQLVDPTLIVTVGRTAGDWIPDHFPEYKSQNRIHSIVHPASILKAPAWQKPEAISRCINKLTAIFNDLIPF